MTDSLAESAKKASLSQLETEAEQRGKIRLRIGSLLSLGVLILMVANIIIVNGAPRWPWALPLNNLGDWLAGLGGGLAFVWLVLGYFQQADELKLQRKQLEFQREELEMSRREAKRLADEAGASNRNQQRNGFIQFAQLAVPDLYDKARLILWDMYIAEVTYEYDDGRMRSVDWERRREAYAVGDQAAFVKELVVAFERCKRSTLVTHFSNSKARDRARGFVSLASSLIETCRVADEGGPLETYCRYTAWAICHSQLAALLDDINAGG